MSVLLTSAIEWVAATSLGRVAHAKAGIGVNFKCAKTLFGVSEKKFISATFTGGVNNFSVPLLVGLAGDHNNDDDNGDDDDEKNDDGNVIVDHDDLAGDHDVLGEVRTAWIFELLLNVLAPVAHLVSVICGNFWKRKSTTRENR